MRPGDSVAVPTDGQPPADQVVGKRGRRQSTHTGGDRPHKYSIGVFELTRPQSIKLAPEVSLIELALNLMPRFLVYNAKRPFQIMRHDYDQKHRHAPARDLSYRRWNRYFDRTWHRHHHGRAGAAGRNFYPDWALGLAAHASNSIICLASLGPMPASSCLK